MCKITLSLLLLLLPSGAAQMLACGDCNGDGLVDVLDSLNAAQHGAGTIVLSGDDLRRCDVVQPVGVDVIDALILAQHAARLPVTLVCAPATRDWRQRQPAASPSARASSVMVYDAARNVTLLYGGVDAGGNFLNETWEWNGTTWSQRVAPLSPPARIGHGMVFDSARNVVLLYGGHAVWGYHEDTWEWDGNAWNLRFPATFPPGRADFGMAFDPGRNVTVIFGGTTNFLIPLVDDVWEWDGTDWAARTPFPRPDARDELGLVQDTSRGVTLLFGGGLAATESNDTWAWDGMSWTQQQPVSPPPARRGHALVDDLVGGGPLLFGGYALPTVLDDAWQWDGASWQILATVSTPPARWNHAMAFDAGRGVTVLFGGDDGAVLGDTWELGP